jgi:hypothetical protein
MAFFTELEKNNPKIYIKSRKKTKTILSKRRNSGSITTPDLKTDYIAIVTK